MHEHAFWHSSVGRGSPSHAAVQAPVPQLTVAPEQEPGPQLISHEPAPQFRFKSPQPSLPAHSTEQGKLGGQLIVATSQASWFVHWTTQAKFSGQSTVAPSHDGSPAQSIAQIVLPS